MISYKYYFLVLFAGMHLFALSQDYNIVNLKTIHDEFNVVLSPNEKTIYFSIANHPDNTGGKKDKGDIWYSTLQTDGKWSLPVNAGSILNNSNINRVLGFSGDGKVMFLHGHYASNGKVSSQGISKSIWKGNAWSFPENIDVKYFINYSEHQSGSISQDGKTILLAMQSYNSKGNEDLYVMFYEDGKWTEPKNLGSQINTRYQEFTPYLLADNKTLIFSSNGRGGEGSSDMYVSTRLDGTWTSWTTPISVGKEINTKGKDWNYIPYHSGRKIIYVTTQNSEGYGDIRFVEPINGMDSVFAELMVAEETIEVEEIPDVVNQLLFYGTVTNEQGMELSEFTIVLGSNNKEIERLNTSEDGTFSFVIEAGMNYDVYVEAPAYIPQKFTVLIDSSSVEKLIKLQPVIIGTAVKLENVLFKQGTSIMLEGFEDELDVIVQMMKKNASMEILLEGHTDNRGRHKDNVKLSTDRVNVVKDYLVQNGIEAKRITSKGFGGSSPIASNEKEETRRLNRRVEFVITKY